MGVAPWMKLYSKELLADPKIKLLTHDQLGKLVLLWAYANEADCCIPSSPADLARLLGVQTPRQMLPQMVWIRRFFVPLEDDPSRLVSLRLLEEQRAYQAKCETLKANGSRGGRPKKPDGLADGSAKGLADAKPSGKPDTNQTQTEVGSKNKEVHSSLRSECGAELPAAPPAPRSSRAGKAAKRAPRAAKVVPLERSLEEILGGKGSQTWERFWKTVGCWPRDKVPAPKRVAAAWLAACEKEDPRRIYLAALHYRDEFLRANPRPGGPPVDETRFMRSPLEWLEQEGWVTELVAIDAAQPPTPEVAHG